MAWKPAHRATLLFLREILIWALDRPNSHAITHALSRGAHGAFIEIRSASVR